jgi:hypothetical protein
LGNAHPGASLRDGPTVFGNHLVLLSSALTCATCHWAGCYLSHSYASLSAIARVIILF